MKRIWTEIVVPLAAAGTLLVARTAHGADSDPLAKPATSSDTEDPPVSTDRKPLEQERRLTDKAARARVEEKVRVRIERERPERPERGRTDRAP